MYMCDLIVYTLREMCWGVVVLAGEKSLAHYYNIRHAILHELLTFMTTRFWQFITLDKYITTIVDSMSMEDFQQYVRNDMWDYLGNLSFSGVLEEVNYTLDDEMLEEFITEIKNDSKD